MHCPLDDYLAQVEQRLQVLPAEERHSELQEIRQHLESLITANRELGDTEEEAVVQALAQFGRAPAIGRELTRVRRRRGIERADTLLGVVLFSYLTGTIFSLILYRLFVFSSPFTTFALILLYGRGLPTTCSVGWLTGAVLPRSAVRGTFLAHLLSLGLSLLVTLRLHEASGAPLAVPGFSQWFWFYFSLAINTAAGMFMALLGAKTGARWRTQLAKPIRV